MPAGLAAVAAAKADGRWEKAYEGSANAAMHPEFLAALEEEPEAMKMYLVLNKQNQYAIYWRLQQLKTEAGKKKKIKEFVEMLAKGETLHPQKLKAEVVEGSSKQVKGKAKRKTANDSDGEVQAPSAPKRAKKSKGAADVTTTVEVVTHIEKVEEKVESRRQGLRQRKPKP
ncbi:hypothetical protein ABW20_dc0109458 [Dactylellina cionopaga]|nr:hypothetical protein ABW20_dc0109458 [Dactylellina cionopaga]